MRLDLVSNLINDHGHQLFNWLEWSAIYSVFIIILHSKILINNRGFMVLCYQNVTVESHSKSTWYFTTTMRTWLWALSISEIFDGNNKRFIYQLFILDCDCIIIWCLVFVRAHNWLVHFNRFVAHFGTCHPSRLLCRVTGRNQRIALFQRLI